jgi:hypothetical protein
MIAGKCDFHHNTFFKKNFSKCCGCYITGENPANNGEGQIGKWRIVNGRVNGKSYSFIRLQACGGVMTWY